jgi:hypothetical protein
LIIFLIIVVKKKRSIQLHYQDFVPQDRVAVSQDEVISRMPLCIRYSDGVELYQWRGPIRQRSAPPARYDDDLRRT